MVQQVLFLENDLASSCGRCIEDHCKAGGRYFEARRAQSREPEGEAQNYRRLNE